MLTRLTGVMTLALFMVLESLAAGTVRWSGGTSTEWSTTTNWTVVSGSPSLPPSGLDDVEMGATNPSFNPSITSTTGAVTIKSLTLLSANKITVTLTSGSTGSLTITGNLVSS